MYITHSPTASFLLDNASMLILRPMGSSSGQRPWTPITLSIHTQPSLVNFFYNLQVNKRHIHISFVFPSTSLTNVLFSAAIDNDIMYNSILSKPYGILAARVIHFSLSGSLSAEFLAVCPRYCHLLFSKFFHP